MTTIVPREWAAAIADDWEDQQRRVRELHERLMTTLQDADCRRRRVGAVLVLAGEVIGTGHNALPEGSCTAGECPRGWLSYAVQPASTGYAATGCTAVHAEDRALQRARAAGHPTKGAICLVTATPCPGCERKLRAAGVTQWFVVQIPEEPTPAAAGQ